jgi:seryl-tRNA synthetase
MTWQELKQEAERLNREIEQLTEEEFEQRQEEFLRAMTELKEAAEALNGYPAEKNELEAKINDYEQFLLSHPQRESAAMENVECSCRGNNKNCIRCDGTGIRKTSPNKPLEKSFAKTRRR